MAKGTKGREKFSGKNSNRVYKEEKVIFGEDDLDDEIDAFHKQRDVVPLDADEDEVANSDDEMDHSVFDVEASDDSDDSQSDEEDGEDEDQIKDKNYLAMARQAKYISQKFPASAEIPDDEDNESEEEGKKAIWGRSKNRYYSADNVHEPGSSDEEQLKEEEDEVVKIQKKRAESLTLGDFGLEDDIFNDSDGPEQAFQDAFSGKRTSEKHKSDTLDVDKEVKIDISALSKEEQMEVVNSSAPELVGLLSELDKAANQLEEVKLHLSWAAKLQENTAKGVTNYLEVKQTLLLSYCQAITFYLLLKSEGHSIRDHPVISRLVEIKNLLEKMEQIDTDLKLSCLIEEFANNHAENENANANNDAVPMELETNMDATPESSESTDVNDEPELAKDNGFSKELVSKISNSNQEMGLQSIEMLKIRANLEEKLKKKGMYNSSNPSTKQTKSHGIKPANKRLETFDDFDDDVQLNGKRDHQGNQMIKSSKMVATEVKKPKFVSGDDDLPKRDDIGERRRQFEMRVLNRARAGSDDEGNTVENGDEDEDAMLTNSSGEDEGEDEYYEKVKKQRIDKLKAKAQVYSRIPAIPAQELEMDEEGKRQISYQMEKNRGLTRHRKKLLKNPRKKYKIKHQKAVIRRKGQVRDIKKPTGPYGGEATGINANVSHSIRIKS